MMMTTASSSSSSVTRWMAMVPPLLLILLLSSDPVSAFGSNPSSLLPPRSRTSSTTALHNNNKLDKGFNLLEIASSVVPQGRIVSTVKESWKFGWQRMMAELAPQDKDGRYTRPSYSFENFIGKTPSFPDEPGRYHLYVGNPCPWCHRARLVVNILGFDSQEISVTQLVDDPVKASRGGWVFSEQDQDPLYGCKDLRELYDKLSPTGSFKGRCTAPLLVDKKTKRAVSNESSDIVRMLSAATFGRKEDDSSSKLDLYPPALTTEIDATNEWVYRLLNNGCYRCGFATTQLAYDEASRDVREGLRRCEEILAKQDYLCQLQFTEADLRLLPTILRFDGAYAPLFKAGGTHLRIRSDYPNVHAWLKRCWAMPGVPESIDLADATGSYYKQLFPLNPGGILPTPVTPQDLGLE
ncbi:Glutathionyl-hydroquinone reductase [Seminavis robusta]|uniref:Glutathionyl-hydroquinone reductase n=1 Tax=Seminavis robusta TaxID=568900 RepID=A0A9N8DH84_9STRA|nr:Glutathionyl-hydroquinone reductase [Seminavis robusta]|eukprot:Sro87_g046150.1 Glutathionyl-hydroquinone reductase (410) ;mRNA; r:85045-86380